jgi:hypothetical protein
MAYLGRQPIVGNYQVLDALTATTTDTYALTKNSVAVFPQTPANCIVSLNGVIQAPYDSYTISGSNIVFASALTGSDSIDFITVLGDVLNVGTVSDGTIGLAKLSATGTPSASTYLRGDNTWGAVSVGDNTPSFRVTMSTNPSFANETWTKAPFNTVDWDTDSAFDNTTNYRFTVPSGEAGKYCFICKGGIDNLDVGEFIATAYYINGTIDNHSYNTVWVAKTTNGFGYVNNVFVKELSVGDYVEVYFQHNEGASQNLNSSYTFFGGFKLSGV